MAHKLSCFKMRMLAQVQMDYLHIFFINCLDKFRQISKMGNSSATGFDEIDSTIIKLAVVPLLQPTNLINLTITTQTFPTKWKIGHVVPLYKGKNLPKHCPISYRPITLLPIASFFLWEKVPKTVFRSSKKYAKN